MTKSKKKMLNRFLIAILFMHLNVNCSEVQTFTLLDDSIVDVDPNLILTTLRYYNWDELKRLYEYCDSELKNPTSLGLSGYFDDEFCQELERLGWATHYGEISPDICKIIVNSIIIKIIYCCCYKIELINPIKTGLPKFKKRDGREFKKKVE